MGIDETGYDRMAGGVDDAVGGRQQIPRSYAAADLGDRTAVDDDVARRHLGVGVDDDRASGEYRSHQFPAGLGEQIGGSGDRG